MTLRYKYTTQSLDAAYFYRQSSVVCRSVCLSVCLSVCHDREPCRNGWTVRYTVWDVDSGGSKEPCIRWDAHWCNLANTTEPFLRGSDGRNCLRIKYILTASSC